MAERSSVQPFGNTLKQYLAGWHRYDSTLHQPPNSLPGLPAAADAAMRGQYWLSANVLKADEDKTYPGAFVASPTDPWGQSVPATTGHPWPLLAGERAEQDLQTGDVSAAASLAETMQLMSSGLGLVPEQAWEDPGTPASPYGSDPATASIGFINGKAAGSADPLIWAQAQYLRLVLDVHAGQLLDQPAITRDRYVTSGPPATVPLTISVTAPGAVATPPSTSTAAPTIKTYGSQCRTGSRWRRGGRTSVADRYHRRPGRGWSGSDRGRRSGDRHLVRFHHGRAGAQRHPSGRTPDLGAVPAGSAGRAEPGTVAVPAEGHGVRADAGHRRRRHLGRRATTGDGRPRRFRPRPAGSDPRDVPLTMARRLPGG